MIKDISSGFVKGFYYTSKDVLTLPFIVPSFLRKAKDKELYFQRIIKEEKESIWPYMGLGASITPCGIVDLGVISYIAYELIQGNKLFALTLASTNALSYIYESGKANAKNKLKQKNNLSNLESVVSERE